jgi:HD superfamily phosphohydrolase
MREKIIRDPVHDVIAFDLDQPADRLLFALVGSAEVQRLRRIRQLGLAHLAYPGADHSRYSHSLGVMQTARRMLDRLGQISPIDPLDRAICVVAALLHDLGHGPFSHVFERVTGQKHELLTRRVILDPTSHVHRLLIEFDTTMPERVVAMLDGQARPRFLADVISGSLDADRFDYLLRDNLMTGSRYGEFDLGWLLAAISVDPVSERLVVLPKAISAVEAYLQARYHMYRNVYFHKVVRSAEGMLRLALRRARRLAVQERLGWPGLQSSVGVGLQGQRLSMKQFLDLDDVALLGAFKAWAESGEDPVLARLSSGILYRRLYKSIDLTRHADPANAFVRAAQAVLDAGGDPEYDLFFDEPVDTPYAFEPAGEKGIRVLMADGRLVDIAEISPMTDALNRQLVFKRIHVDPAHRAAVLKAIDGAAA